MSMDTITLLKELALVWFFLVFSGAVAVTFGPGSRRLEKYGRLPLEEGRPQEGAQG